MGLRRSINQTLLCSVPALELLFAVDGFVHVIEGFVVNGAVAAVLFGKSFDLVVLVLRDTAVETVGHADVDHAGFAGHDVDAVAVIVLGSSRAESRSLDSASR